MAVEADRIADTAGDGQGAQVVDLGAHLLAGDDQAPFGRPLDEARKPGDQALQSLVRRDPAEIYQRLGASAGEAGETIGIHRILDEKGFLADEAGEACLILLAACEHGGVATQRPACHRSEPKLFEPPGKASVEEAAVGCDQKRRAMKRPCPAKKVGEEFDPMHMHDIGACKMLQDARRKRIASRPPERNAQYLHPGQHLAWGQRFAVAVENPVERDDPYIMTSERLRLSEL